MTAKLPLFGCVATLALGVTAFTACEEEPDTGVPLAQMQAARPEALERPAGGGRPAMLTGVVRETMDSGGYTYVMLDTGAEKVWAAGPPTPVAVNERVSVATDMPMQGFHSKTLDRTFDVIYFAPTLNRLGPAPADAPAPAAAAPAAAEPGAPSATR